ncbi:MAG: creatininase family protein [Phycisphaeraceae bacterium]|nr:creatininase family protein [Phycisphaeraceae bacterium]
MRDEVCWERMFPDELEEAFARRPVVWLPQGLCEPHGPHNTLGLDALKAWGICVAAAKRHGGIVCPPDFWHVHETGAYAPWASDNIGEARPWMTALPVWMHFKMVAYQLRAFDALGFEAVVILTGHYGPNWVDLKKLVELLQPHFAMRIYALPDCEACPKGFDGEGKHVADHAGVVETSLLWALRPECVDMSRLPKEGEAGKHFAMSSSARMADRRVGERMVAEEVAYLGGKVEELLAEYAKSKPSERKAVSFVELEGIWKEVVLPELPRMKCMQNVAAEKMPGEGSRWRLNCWMPEGIEKS